MKIGLIAEDSKLPNYALMKVYAYHKSIGDEVDFALPFEYYDIIYRSKIFNFSQPDNGVYFSQLTIKGGTGYDIASKLPDYIDNLNPEILKVLIISNNNIMAIKKIKKDYHSKEEIPANIKKDFDSASVHLSACWMLMSIVMQHLDEAQDAVRRYGAHKFEVKQNFDAINHHFDKLNDWYRKLAMKSAQGMELFNKEYPEITAQINKLLGFDECGFTYQEENNDKKDNTNE